MKRPGHCALCGEPVREIVKKHTKGKLKGEPIQLGPWLENAWRVTYELSDGSIADITLCDKCPASDHDAIWAAVKDRFLWEEETRKERDLEERGPAQKEVIMRELDRIFGLSIKREVGRRLWKFADGRYKGL